MFLEVVVELSIGDARFDEGVAEVGIDLKYAVHTMQIKHHLSTLGRGSGAVAQVLSGRDRPNRHLVFVADAHNFLNLLDSRRQDCRRRRMIRLGHRHHDLGVGRELVRAREHVGLAQDPTEVCHSGIKGLFGNPFR